MNLNQLLPPLWLLGPTITLFWFCGFLEFAVLTWYTCRMRDNRIHWLEFHEQRFCPAFIKSVFRLYLAGGWDSYGWSSYVGSAAHDTADEIASAVQRNGYSAVRVLDMCSGGGGPVPLIHSALCRQLTDVRTVLTDLFPETTRWEALSSELTGLSFCSESVDAMDVAANELLPTLGTDVDSDKAETKPLTLRTFYASFHHFKPEQTVSLLSDAIQNGHAVVVVEPVIRRQNLPDFIKNLFVGVVALPLAIPYITKSFWNSQIDSVPLKVLKCAAALLTLPLTLSILFHDTIISCARCYSLPQLRQLPGIARADALKHKSAAELPTYQWQAYQKVHHAFGIQMMEGVLTFLVGIPKNSDYNYSLSQLDSSDLDRFRQLAEYYMHKDDITFMENGSGECK